MICKLTSIESFMLALDGPASPANVEATLYLSGRVEPGLMRRAVRRAMDLHPITRCRLRSRSGKPVWFLGGAAPAAGWFRSLDLRGGDLEEFTGSQMSSPFHLKRECPLRVFLLRTGEERWTLLGVFHHAASDGVGAFRFLRTVLEAYAALHKKAPLHRTPDPFTPGEREPLFRVPLEAFGDARFYGSIAHDWFTRLEHLWRAPALRFHPTHAPPGGKADVRVLERSLPAAGVLAAARSSGVTVNDLLLAALAETIALHSPDGPSGSISIMMPINLRPAERRDEVVSNLVSSVSVAIDPAAVQDRRRLLQTISKQTRYLKENRVAFSMVLLSWGTSLQPRGLRQTLYRGFADAFAETAVLSNLGTLWPPRRPAGSGTPLEFTPGGEVRAGEATLTGARFTPPVAMPVGVSIGAATYGGILTLGFRHYRHILTQARITRFADTLLERLQVLGEPQARGAPGGPGGVPREGGGPGPPGGPLRLVQGRHPPIPPGLVGPR